MGIFSYGVIVIMLIIIIGHYFIKIKPQLKYFKIGRSPLPYLSGIFILFIAILYIPIFIKYHYNLPFRSTGEIGDIIGGATSPFLALIGIIVTFYAFWIQYVANLIQRKEFNSQDKETKIDRFESKLYTFIEIHRENVKDIEIANKITGRRAFLAMFNELRFTFLVCEEYYSTVYNPSPDNDKLIPPEVRYNISYFIFFFGIGPNSTKIINDLIPSKYLKFSSELIQHLDITKREYRKDAKSINIRGTTYQYTLSYTPFDGHTSKLSHYIRHIFQTVTFIDTYNNSIINSKEKKAYMRTFRAQLSVYEQLFIYYNSLSVLGKPWLEVDDKNESLIEKYAIVKSIPLPLADFYITPKQKFKKEINFSGDDIFEWDSIKNRIGDMN